MKIKELLQAWEGDASQPLTADEYRLRLPIYEAAKIHALAELYPGRTPEQLMTDLLSAALDELQAHFPYVKGDRIVAQDEQGDPIYEDTGPGPRFHDLIRAHVEDLRQRLRQRKNAHAVAAPAAAVAAPARRKPAAARTARKAKARGRK